VKISFNIGSFRFYFGFYRFQKVKGAISRLPSGDHILMWEFDDVDEDRLKSVMKTVQTLYKLPDIYLINTGIPNHWHCWCFKKVTWGEALKIIASTPHVDHLWFVSGVARNYFTLRYTPKIGRELKPAIILKSRRREDISPYDLRFQSIYITER